MKTYYVATLEDATSESRQMASERPAQRTGARTMYIEMYKERIGDCARRPFALYTLLDESLTELVDDHWLGVELVPPTGDDPQDQLANQGNGVHLRLMIGEILATSFGLVIRKGDQPHGTD